MHHQWQCREGHRWEAVPNSVKTGTWCPVCAGHGKPSMDDIQHLAKERGGKCLSQSYRGQQHYDTQGHFFGIEKNLSRRQEDDALKSTLCAQRGIALVAVPQIPDLLHVDQVRAFIKEQLRAKGIPLLQDFDTRDVDINRAYATAGSREILDCLRAIATEHGGQCLSRSYIDNNTKLLWQCAKGHKWEAIPNSMKQGHWCPFCAGYGKTIQDMQQLAAQHGGKCLSPTFEGMLTSLLWECSQGHQWKATPSHVAGSTWCPYCYGRGQTIEDMRRLAAQRGGECLSLAFLGAHTHLMWRCAEGHEWRAVPHSIRHGTWCPVCSKERRRPRQRDAR
jgi:thiol-disulfide isomerase/thioredoxin